MDLGADSDRFKKCGRVLLIHILMLPPWGTKTFFKRSTSSRHKSFPSTDGGRTETTSDKEFVENKSSLFNVCGHNILSIYSTDSQF